MRKYKVICFNSAQSLNLVAETQLKGYNWKLKERNEIPAAEATVSVSG